jgi:hypothetical protein
VVPENFSSGITTANGKRWIGFCYYGNFVRLVGKIITSNAAGANVSKRSTVYAVKIVLI